MASLREGAGQETVEIVVVDDGSPSPLESLPGARVLRLEQNGGFGQAVNAGVRAATGNVLVVLNSDLRPERTFLRDLLEAARQEFPAVVGPLITEHGVVMENRSSFPLVASVVRSRSAIPTVKTAQPALVSQPSTARGNSEVEWVSGAAFCLPREIFDLVGGFDEDFYMYMEDVDLQHRLRDAGVRRVLLSRVAVEHVGAASSTPEDRREWIVDSAFVYFKKRGRLMELALTWFVMIVTNTVYDVVRRLTGRRVMVWRTAAQQIHLFRSGLRAAGRASRTHKVPS